MQWRKCKVGILRSFSSGINDVWQRPRAISATIVRPQQKAMPRCCGLKSRAGTLASEVCCVRPAWKFGQFVITVQRKFQRNPRNEIVRRTFRRMFVGFVCQFCLSASFVSWESRRVTRPWTQAFCMPELQGLRVASLHMGQSLGDPMKEPATRIAMPW